ncbi:hypothetical protein KIN34_04320 [Cellulomonas sp. DKR-3]|uniref:AbiEi antitoxin N-terminal domain-containing protein n=1 Tax=Cellulomonas fulva TaxID=2835530 RepID=A0ABS5TWH3_9CELL|nr:type IV toxin-antitoxin system AbiEi family antitoxin domain-containing protein [Cellulomonas fulva]MBT0993509.1 hypothetical protein [Cellulomonas fulva]
MDGRARVESLPAVRRLAPAARALVVRQDGVVTGAQLAEWGYGRSAVSRRVAAGDWQRAFRGVVVLQSGPTSWRQRARAALLYAGPGAALSHESAAYHHGILRGPGPLITLTVPHHRTVTPRPGLVVHRRRSMPWTGGRLPSVEPAEAVLGLAASCGRVDDLVGLLCDAVRAGLHPDDLLLRAGRRARMRGRALLVELLGEVADGVESPLEHRYRRDVERAHGLPTGAAQRWERVDGRWIRADRVYSAWRVRVELDGRLAHPFGATDADVWRDNAVLLATSERTLRYRWHHVAVTPCATAAQVATALRAGGWPGPTTRCSACP